MANLTMEEALVDYPYLQKEWEEACDEIMMHQVGASYEQGYIHGSNGAWKVFKERLDRVRAQAFREAHPNSMANMPAP